MGLKDERKRRIKVFRSVIRFLKMKINHGFPDDEVTVKNPRLILMFATPVILTGSISLIGTLGFLFMAVKNGITSEQVLSFSILFQYIVIYMIMFITYLNATQWMIFLEELGEYKYGKPPNYREMYTQFDTWANYGYYSLKVITLLQFLYSLTTNSFCDGRDIRGDHRYICGSSIPLWFPIEIRSQIIRAMLIVGGNAISFFHYPVIALYSLIFFGSIQLLVMRVRHLKRLLSEIVEDEGLERIDEKLYTCIKYHSEIVRLMKKMNVAVGNALLPYYASLPLILAMYGYQTLHIRDISLPIILLLWFGIVSSLCLAGQRLETESLSLIESVYDLPFHKINRKLMKNYQLFFARVGNPLNIRIKSLAELNNDFYITVMKGCYSYMMFLLQMSRKTIIEN